jgi:hypothetical protein
MALVKAVVVWTILKPLLSVMRSRGWQLVRLESLADTGEFILAQKVISEVWWLPDLSTVRVKLSLTIQVTTLWYFRMDA